MHTRPHSLSHATTALHWYDYQLQVWTPGWQEGQVNQLEGATLNSMWQLVNLSSLPYYTIRHTHIITTCPVTTHTLKTSESEPDLPPTFHWPSVLCRETQKSKRSWSFKAQQPHPYCTYTTDTCTYTIQWRPAKCYAACTQEPQAPTTACTLDIPAVQISALCMT